MRRLVWRGATCGLVSVSLIAVTAASAASRGGGSRSPAALAVPGPPIPITRPKPITLPKTPNPKTRPGAMLVTFKLVVEGVAQDIGHRNATGELGPCAVALQETINERTDFQRGKGVTMEFIRYRQHGQMKYAIQRVGRNGDASFALVYSLSRTATGNTTWTPVFAGPCLRDEDFSKNSDCGKTFKGTSNWGLKLKGTEFSLAPLGIGGNFVAISECGKSSEFNGLENLFYQWPEPASLGVTSLPLAKLFGHTSQFKLQLKSGFLSNKAKSMVAGVTETQTDLGSTFATVRLSACRTPNCSIDRAFGRKARNKRADQTGASRCLAVAPLDSRDL